MIKALFFDIDGTLVSINTHEIPQSTIESIRKAKEKGLKVYISTGRPIQFITNLSDINDLIDGYITTNGANCFVGDKTINLIPIPKEDVFNAIRLSNEMNFACVVVGKKDATVCNRNNIFDDLFIDMLKVPECFDNALDKVLEQDILQLTPFVTKEQEEKIMPYLPNSFSARWHPEFTDITAIGVDKGSALISFAKSQGFDIDETMAFGDGGNDISIIQNAGIGVVMGNAKDYLKEYADYVTTSVDDDGIKNALEHFAII